MYVNRIPDLVAPEHIWPRPLNGPESPVSCREMLKAMDKDSRTPSVQDQLEQQASGFRTLRRVSLSLHRERRTVGRVFRMPAQGACVCVCVCVCGGGVRLGKADPVLHSGTQVLRMDLGTQAHNQNLKKFGNLNAGCFHSTCLALQGPKSHRFTVHLELRVSGFVCVCVCVFVLCVCVCVCVCVCMCRCLFCERPVIMCGVCVCVHLRMRAPSCNGAAWLSMYACLCACVCAFACACAQLQRCEHVCVLVCVCVPPVVSRRCSPVGAPRALLLVRGRRHQRVRRLEVRQVGAHRPVHRLLPSREYAITCRASH